MPRLDLDNPETVETLDSIDFTIVKVARSEDAPVDVCVHCYEANRFKDDVEHPWYAEDEYYCTLCGVPLYQEDE